MPMTGVLVESSGITTLKGTRLARQGANDPFTAATNFLANNGFDDGDRVTVDGSTGSVGTVPAFFITSVQAAAGFLGMAAAAGISKSAGKKRAARKSTKKRARKSTKKSAKKSSKKTSKKTKAAKKSTKKSGRKSAKKRPRKSSR